jgi:hypothetical protein
MSPNKTLCLDVAGLGIIIYSPFSTDAIQPKEDYLEHSFSDPAKVETQAVEGRIVGVSTGTPGRFILDFADGYPPQEIVDKHRFKLRLGVEVRDQTLCIRDLYDLLQWEPTCPVAQTIGLEDGFYDLTLLSDVPQSDMLGDDQVIKVYFQKVSEMPKLRYNGVPTLC